MSAAPDLAQIRLNNALVLFDEFVHNTIKHPDAATLRGLEGRFAERVGIQPSYWSQIKSRARQIGERLARQFEQQCKKPMGWMDQDHGNRALQPTATSAADDDLTPRDGDERFIMGLVLTYYRRHPQRARQRLLDLLGEVLMSGATPPAAPTHPVSTPAMSPKPAPASAGHSAPVAEDSLWQRSQQGVAPLRRKK